MVIIIADDLSKTGGIQHAILELYEFLSVELDQKVIIVCRVPPKKNIQTAVVLSNLSLGEYLFKLFSFIRKQKPNTVISSDCIFSITLLLLKATKSIENLISWEHLAFDNNSQYLRSLSRPLCAIISDRIVTITNEQSVKWNQLIPKNKSKALPIPNLPPYNLLSFTPPPQTPKTNKILVIGNNIYVKGVDQIINAFSLINMNDWFLEICGLSSHDVSFLKSRNAKISSNITFSYYEYDTDYPTLYAAIASSRLVLNFSRTEVLPLTQMEAYIMGTHFAASSYTTPGLAYNVLSYHHGFVFTHYSQKYLARFLYRFISVSHRNALLPSLEDRRRVLKSARFKSENLWKSMIN